MSETAAKVPGFRFVADEDFAMIDAFDVRHAGGGVGGDCAYPTTVLIDDAARIQWTFRPLLLMERASPETVLEAIDQHLRAL